MGAGMATWLAIPTSANLAAAMADETGTGPLVFANSPVFTTPNIGSATGHASLDCALAGCTFPLASVIYLPDGGTLSQYGFSITSISDTGLTTRGATCNSAAGLLSTTTTGCANFVQSAATGGTGLSTAAIGDLMYASATTPIWSRLAAVATGAVLGSQGTSTAPAWLTSVTLSGAILSSGATNGVGYATGAGGTVSQSSSKSTGVTLNKATGAITMNGATLAAGTIVSFVLTDSAIAATDTLVLNHISGGTIGSYTLNAQAAAGSATINVRNNTSGSLGEAIVIEFTVIKGVTSWLEPVNDNRDVLDIVA
jgi:hypothetical protein